MDYFICNIIDNLNKQNIKITYNTIDIEYKKIYEKFSPAYLSGSYWYVGPSLKDYLNTKNTLFKSVLSYMIINYIGGLPPQ